MAELLTTAIHPIHRNLGTTQQVWTVASKCPGETGDLAPPVLLLPRTATQQHLKRWQDCIFSTLSCHRYSFNGEKKNPFPSADNTSLDMANLLVNLFFSEATCFTTNGFDGVFFFFLESNLSAYHI